MPASEILEMSSSVLIDTCVLADALFVQRPRHQQGLEVFRAMKQNGARALFPAHAMFELVSVAFSDKHRLQEPLLLGNLGKSLPVPLDIVDVNEALMQTHLLAAINSGVDVNSSGGDMIFLAVAFGQQCPFVTEDQKLLAKAKKIGLVALSAYEYASRSAEHE